MNTYCLDVSILLHCCKSLQHYGKTNAMWQDPYNYKLCANPFHPVCITCKQQQWSLEGHCSRQEWIPSQRVLVYLAALSLSGPSVETQHHNRMIADQGNTVRARGCSVLLFCACVINILAVFWCMKQAVDDWWELAKRAEWAANHLQWSKTYHPTNGTVLG